MSNTHYIYMLVDPISHKPFYIGQTNNINKRLYDHVSKLQNKKKDEITKRIIKANRIPEIVILNETDGASVDDLERRWITFMLLIRLASRSH